MPEYADRQLEQMLDDYQRQRSALSDIYSKMQTLTGTAESPRRELEVTAKHTGAVVNITFAGTAFRRLGPKEISELVMRTIDAAVDKAVAEAADLIAPTLPSGVNARDLLAGRVDMEALAPSAGPRMASVVRDQFEK